MNTGQVYNITFNSFLSSSIRDLKLKRKAKLIFENNFFYTFEYRTKSKEILRVTIDKLEHKNNPGLIAEV